MFFANILIKIYYTNIILLKSIFIALCLKKFLILHRKILFFPDWWYNGRGLSTKHRWYSENTNHHKRHFGNQFQNQGDLHSEYTHCLKIQKIFNWKIDSIFFFPQIIIGHGYKHDWCGWATLRTKEMAKMFWFSSSSDLCSFLSRIWSGIHIHPSKINNLCSSLNSKEMLQNFLYLYKKKTQVVFFVFHFEQLSSFPYECPGLCRHRPGHS